MSAERGKMAAEARQCVPGTQSPLFHVPRTFFLTKWKCGTVHRAWQRTVGVLFVNKKLQLGGKIKKINVGFWLFHTKTFLYLSTKS